MIGLSFASQLILSIFHCFFNGGMTFDWIDTQGIITLLRNVHSTNNVVVIASHDEDESNGRKKNCEVCP